jgi:hypothetical protein
MFSAERGARMGRGGVIIVGLAIGGLLASGCSSGSSGSAGSSGGSSSPSSAGSPSSTVSPTAATVATGSVRVGRLTEIFDGPLPADSAQASVIEGFRAGLILFDKSQEELRLVSPVTSDVTGAALTNLKKSLTQALIPEHIVPAGIDRNFKTRVSALSGASATVTTCDDGSKFDEVNPDTGVVNTAYSATPDEEYIFVTWQMTRLDGHWAISVITPVTLPNPLAKPCQPLPV